MPEGVPPRELSPGDQIGRYQIVRLLGRGGMGVVYVARDERLARDVALKMIAGLPDELARMRFWREARIAASVSHPNVCQVFEVEDTGGSVFLTMELLEGEGLDRRLLRGALPPKDAVPIALGILRALDALHGRGIVHRDVKPSNVFLTPHGPKLLDFGLARPSIDFPATSDGTTPGTQSGAIVGTPEYMAPEQIKGEFPLDGRTDLYSAGAVIFQMLAGRPPFMGTIVNLLHAALTENPPALQGPPEVIAVDRVIRRAMRKAPAERYESAADMTADLSAISLSGMAAATAMPVRALTRVVVAPLRLSTNDPEIAYLQFGLAEAVSGSLAMLGNIVVRAPAVAAKWNDEQFDPRQLAAKADVDLVISSSLRRAGSQLRVTTQVIDPSSGTVVGATTIIGSMDDIFALEDALTNAATALLSPQLTVGQPAAAAAPKRDVPANPRAFEFFLRGMEASRTLTGTASARDLFQRAVEEDPNFAPAWAGLGRAHRVWGKFYDDRDESNRLAEAALRRALELSPELPIAHHYLTHFESEQGRAGDAIVRLLNHAKTNRHDARLFAGLVHACRYAGLFDASMAAHEEARRLDPNVDTGIEYTLGHLAVTSAHAADLMARYSDSPGGYFVLGSIGDAETAKRAISKIDLTQLPPAFRLSLEAFLSLATRPPAEAIGAINLAMSRHADPEALFQFGAMLIRAGDVDRGIDVIGDAVSHGYSPASTLSQNSMFDAVRERDRFKAAEAEALRRRRAAQEKFEAAGGPEMLGMPAATRLSN